MAVADEDSGWLPRFRRHDQAPPLVAISGHFGPTPPISGYGNRGEAQKGFRGCFRVDPERGAAARRPPRDSAPESRADRRAVPDDKGWSASTPMVPWKLEYGSGRTAVAPGRGTDAARRTKP